MNTSEAWRAALVAALERGVQATRATHAAAPERVFYYPYVLWATTALYEHTREEVWLEATRAELRAVVAVLGAGGASPGWVTTHFRFLAPIAAAVRLVEREGGWEAEERKGLAGVVRTTMTARVGFMDYGAQNRGLIYGAEFWHAAELFPEEADAALWRKIGEALVADSLEGWGQEDASGYESFWLSYALEIAEAMGVGEAHLRRTTTRFYFEQAAQLLMPGGLLPDWGDGDWTHGWSWHVANLARGGSRYREGRWLDAGRRLLEANLPLGEAGDPEALGGLALALRWLDATVPWADSSLTASAEVGDDMIGKKHVFRSAAGAYLLFNYRDEKAGGCLTRRYLAQQLWALEEKPHHGHADEQAVIAFCDRGTMLLADGGYRDDWARGYRADCFHNRVVVRTGFGQELDPWEGLLADTTYHRVTTAKIHGGNFGSLDYLRTRLGDETRGYTGDRVVLFAPENGLTIVVDALVMDRDGPRQVHNVWHPQDVSRRGEGWVVGRPERLLGRNPSPEALQRGEVPFWANPPGRELLIQFLGNRDKVTWEREIRRRYAPSAVFAQGVKNCFHAGQRLTFVTVLRPHAASTFDPAWLDEVRVVTGPHDDGRTLGLEFKIHGEAVTVGLKLDQNLGLTQLRGRPMFSAETGLVHYGEMATDAEFAFVRTRRDGGREFGLMVGSHVELAGESLLRMPVIDRMWQGPGDFRVAACRDQLPRWHEVIAPDRRGLHV